MDKIDKHMICAYVKAVNRYHNSAYYSDFKAFGSARRAIKTKNDISLYPEKAIYDHYTNVLKDSISKIFTLKKAYKKAICDYIELQLTNEASSIRPYFEKAIIKSAHSGFKHDSVMFGWESEAWKVAPAVIETIIEGFWLLNLKGPKFTKTKQKTAYLNAISSIRELSHWNHGLLIELDELSKALSEEELLTEEKIYQSIYLKLILALSNRLYINNDVPALSTTYAARKEASIIMSHIFNQDHKSSKGPKSFADIGFIKFRGFHLYKLLP